MKRPKPEGERKAFSLIELLVVVCVLGILAALLLPALSVSKARSRSLYCKNNLRQMGLALKMYVDDSRSRFPYYVNFNDTAEIGTFWSEKLVPYYPVPWLKRSYHCPGYKGEIAAPDTRHNYTGSYAYNCRGAKSPFVGHDDPARGKTIRFPQENFGLGPHYTRALNPPAVSESQIVAPAEMMSIGESRFFDAAVNGRNGGDDSMLCGWLHWSNPKDPVTRAWAFASKRHNATYNQLFCDGHISAITPEILFNPTNSALMWNYDHKPHPELWIPDL